MAIHIQDQETDALVRAFARQRNLGITEAVKVAVQEASGKHREDLEDVLRKLEPIWAEIRARRAMPYSARDDKDFMDDMWGEDD